jgi:hypothetical protein
MSKKVPCYLTFLRHLSTIIAILGTPMQIVLWIGTTVYLIVEQWWWCWLGTLALLVAVVAFRLTQDIRTKKAKMD